MLCNIMIEIEDLYKQKVESCVLLPTVKELTRRESKGVNKRRRGGNKSIKKEDTAQCVRP